MLNMLSQEEIDALLDIDDDFLTPQREVLPYDFNKPNMMSKEQLSSFFAIHDKMAKLLASKISSITNSIVEIELCSVDQMRYNDFLMHLPNRTNLNLFSMKPLKGNSVIEINSSIVFSILDTLLGGKGEPFDAKRKFSDIELNLFEMILKATMSTLEEAWKPVVDISANIESKESTLNATQNSGENEVVVTAAMEVSIGQSSGVINICYPASLCESILPKLSAKKLNHNEIGTNIDKNMQLQMILEGAKVEVEAILGDVELTLKNILKLQSGDIIRLSSPADDIVTLCVDSKDRFRGKIGLKKFKKSIQIIEVAQTEKDLIFDEEQKK